MRPVHQFGARLVPFIQMTNTICTVYANICQHFLLHDNLKALHDFNEFLAPYAHVKLELENCSTFFMTLALFGLPQEYATNCD